MIYVDIKPSSGEHAATGSGGGVPFEIAREAVRRKMGGIALALVREDKWKKLSCRRDGFAIPTTGEVFLDPRGAQKQVREGWFEAVANSPVVGMTSSSRRQESFSGC